MTFIEIVSSVSERLNLTSPEALARIGRRVNDRYRRLSSSIGLQTARRATDTQTTAIGNVRVTFALEKLEAVYSVASGKRRVLQEKTYDEWRNSDTWVPMTGDPQWYAIELSGAATVTIVLSHTPTATLELKADGLAPAAILSGSAVPAFPADFHDALVFGAMADESTKLEKGAVSMQLEAQYESRVSDLRLFLAKSIYLKVHQQNRATTGTRRWRV